LAAAGSEGSQGSEGADEGSLEIEGVVAYEIEPVLPPPPPAAPIPKASPPAVYLVAPATGPFSPLGGDVELGVKLGLKSVGDSLALRVLDEDSPGFLRELFASPAPVVAIGHLYEASLAGAWPWYQAAGVPVVSPFLDGLAISELGESFIGLMPSPAAQGLRLAREVPKTGSRRPNQVIILQGPEPADEALAEAFREGLINPPAPEPTRRNPKPAKPRGMNAKLVLTIPVSSAGDLRVLSELKTSSRDVVLLALPSRLVLRCAPALAESDLRRATYLAPVWLATREMGALFIGASMPDFQALVPLGMGTASKPNKSLDELIIRYARAYRREPTWPALVAYEVARLAALAAADEAGAGASLADKELERSGTAGAFTLSPGGWPSTLVKIDESRLSLLP
jgi:ABC-type branched-subunit amino acid transport system substrate-binding protein